MAEFGPNYERVHANTAYLEFVGKSLRSWQSSSNPLDVIAEYHRERAMEMHARLPFEGVQLATIDMVSADGKNLSVAWTNEALTDDDGKIFGIRCIGNLNGGKKKE